MKKQSGQVVIILLLIMLVGLIVAITITQRSVNDLAVSSQTESATRAFSAAEAGLEKAISTNPGDGDHPNFLVTADTGNDSIADVRVTSDLPRRVGDPGFSGVHGQAD